MARQAQSNLDIYGLQPNVYAQVAELMRPLLQQARTKYGNWAQQNLPQLPGQQPIMMGQWEYSRPNDWELINRLDPRGLNYRGY